MHESILSFASGDKGACYLLALVWIFVGIRGVFFQTYTRTGTIYVEKGPQAKIYGYIYFFLAFVFLALGLLFEFRFLEEGSLSKLIS